MKPAVGGRAQTAAVVVRVFAKYSGFRRFPENSRLSHIFLATLPTWAYTNNLHLL
jgi:hypothetical protein